MIVTSEDHISIRAWDLASPAMLAEGRCRAGFVRLGVKGYGFSGKPEELYRSEGITREGIVKAVLNAGRYKRQG